MSNARRVLNLTFVVVLSTLALATPSAHAKNQIVVKGKVLAEGEVVEMEATGGSYRSSIPSLGLFLTCPTGTLQLTLKNQTSGAVGSGIILAHKCTLAEFEEVCESHSTGQPPGLIQVSGESIQVRSLGTARYLESTAKSSAIEHGGEECPFTELALPVSGTGGFRFEEPSTESVSHTVTDITPEEESALEVATFLGGNPLFVEEGEAADHLVGKFEGMSYSVN